MKQDDDRKQDHDDRFVNPLIPASKMKDRFPGTTDQSWASMRHKGTGPVFVRLGGRKVYYRVEDIDAWIAGNRFSRTDTQVAV